MQQRNRHQKQALFGILLLSIIIVHVQPFAVSELLCNSRLTSSNFLIISMTTTTTTTSDTGGGDGTDTRNENQLQQQPVWDPVAQIYVGGVLPENNEEAIQEMMMMNDNGLRIFGYGSLCWNPGTPGIDALAHPSVTTSTGSAVGYRRCWAQKSTDHRGNPSFPGIVCTLLTDAEFDRWVNVRRQPPAQLLPDDNDILESTTTTETEGVIFRVPPELAQTCLAELDFREKGGYARDVITVMERDGTSDDGCSVVAVPRKALLYRGTPDNPAFWPRALRDLPFAAAAMAVAVGPSGRNRDYLSQLDEFLLLRAEGDTAEASSSLLEETKLDLGDDTVTLARMVRQLRNRKLFFLFGSGSNQHDQLNLQQHERSSINKNRSSSNPADLVQGEDAHELKEIVVCTDAMMTATDNSNDASATTVDDPAVEIFAGGGHSGILTRSGALYLFGWNHAGQTATSSSVVKDGSTPCPLKQIASIPDLRVSHCSLGFSHTAIIEEGTDILFCFGNNQRGQVDPNRKASTISTPMCPLGRDVRVVDVAAGLFHTSVVTRSGELVTFGEVGGGKIAATLPPDSSNNADGNKDWPEAIGHWKPPDSATVRRVACGRKHTVALDSMNRVWSLGDDKYGQLGVVVSPSSATTAATTTPTLVDFDWNGTIQSIHCGWSHTIVTVLQPSQQQQLLVAYGFGRNDKGQLGLGNNKHQVAGPIRLFDQQDLVFVACGSESSHFVDGQDRVWSCGWNEHGNLALGRVTAENEWIPTMATGAPITTTPGYGKDDDDQDDCGDEVKKEKKKKNTRLTIAAGGGHLLAMRVHAS